MVAVDFSFETDVSEKRPLPTSLCFTPASLQSHPEHAPYPTLMTKVNVTHTTPLHSIPSYPIHPTCPYIPLYLLKVRLVRFQ